MVNCSLTGVIPEEVDTFPSLSKFLFPKSLEHVWCVLELMTIQYCYPTETLHLSGNFFQTFIPTTFGNLASLTDLRLAMNLLSGPIPSEFGLLANLTNLELQFNFLTGTIPPEIANLSNLENLNIEGNSIDVNSTEGNSTEVG
jgi:Leucine-rich repeat (LRR) protein